MDQRPDMEFDLQYAVVQLQTDVKQLDIDVTLLKRQVQNNEDPKHSLIVIVADLASTVGSVATLVEKLQAKQDEHDEKPHLSQQTLFWRDVGRSVVSALSTVAAIAVLAWIVIGFRASLILPAVTP